MQGEFNYRGLRRWGMLKLLPVLVVGSWVATAFILAATTVASFGAAGIAQIGTMWMGVLAVPPLVGVVGGLFGIFRAKDQVIRAFDAKRLPQQHPLAQTVAAMARHIGMAAPDVYVYPSDDINAWATGRDPDNAVIGISRAALYKLSREDIHAIVGHELGHIAAGDLRRMQFAIGFQNCLVWFACFRKLRWFARHIVGCVGEMGVTALSRRREYWADAVGALLTSPQQMASALEAVHRDQEEPPGEAKQYNQLMMRWHTGGNLLGTHPTLEQRIVALDSGVYLRAVLDRTTRHSSTGQKIAQRLSHAFLLGPYTSGDWFRAEWPSAVAIAMVVGLNAMAGVVYMRVSDLPPAPVASTPLAHQQGPRVAAWSRTIADQYPELVGLHPCVVTTMHRSPEIAIEATCNHDGQLGFVCSFAGNGQNGLEGLTRVISTVERCLMDNGSSLSSMVDYGNGPERTTAVHHAGRLFDVGFTQILPDGSGGSVMTLTAYPRTSD